VHGNELAIEEAEKLSLTEHTAYHSLLGYLYAEKDVQKAVVHYNKALSLTKSKAEKKTLMKEIGRLSNQNS
jgi:RNA polymerase sigma-70 factor (ECF subfamily)